MKIFLDSSLLIEYEKQAKTDLMDALLESEHQLFINPIVFSEYVYQLLGILGGRSPMSICESGKINETLTLHDTKTFLSGFQVMQIPDEALAPPSYCPCRAHKEKAGHPSTPGFAISKG